MAQKWHTSGCEQKGAVKANAAKRHELTRAHSQRAWKFHICLEIPNNFSATYLPHSWKSDPAELAYSRARLPSAAADDSMMNMFSGSVLFWVRV